MRTAFIHGCRGRIRKGIGFVLSAVVLAFGLSLWTVQALTVKRVKPDEIIYIHGAMPETRFAMHSIHSVEHTPIRDDYRIDENYRIVLFETRFRSSNVGQAYAAFGREKFVHENDHFLISGMHRVIPELLVWTNRQYGNSLEIDGGRRPLYTGERPTLVRIAVEPVSALDWMAVKARICIIPLLQRIGIHF